MYPYTKPFNLLLYVIVLCCAFSCGQRNGQVQNPAKDNSDTCGAPKKIIIKSPARIALNACPKPRIIGVPVKAGGKYEIQTKSGTEEVELKPPVINSFPSGQGQGISNFTTYTTGQGLTLDAVSASYMDHNGNLWFGTKGGGVSRYDGKSFTNYTTADGLANNIIWSITEDKNGNMWFGTEGGGVSRYDGKYFATFTTAQGLPNNTIWSIVEDKNGNMWFGSYGGGVSKYDGKSFTNYNTAQGLPNNIVWCIHQDKHGNMWFGTQSGGAACYDGKSFTTYTTAQGLPNNNIWSIAEDRRGNLWFGTDGGGVSCYNGKSFTTYSTAQGLANNSIWNMLEDKEGNMWFATEGGGVSLFNGKSFTNYTTVQGLANNIVWSITMDKTGSLWFGTDGGGVSRYDGEAFTNYTMTQGLANNSVWSILEDRKGSIWFGTYGGGVSCYNGKSFTNYTMAQGLANNNIRSSLEDKTGNLWFGTKGGGVSRYDGKSFTNYSTAQGLANDIVRCILEDRKGNLWFGTYGGGVSCFDGKSFTNYTTVQGLANNSVLSVLEDKAGNIWFGTEGGGVSRYDGESFTNYNTAQGLANNSVWSIMQDNMGNLWFGTDGGGLSRFDGKSFINYTTVQGLADNSITQLIITKEQNIAIGTNEGIAILKGFKNESKDGIVPALNKLSNHELKEYTPVFELYNPKTGYPVKDVNRGQNSMYLDSKGIIWAGTNSEKTALVRFNPSLVLYNPNPPAVILQGVKINEENICWYTYHVSLLKGKIEPKNNNADSSIMAQQEIMTYGKVLTEQERDTMRSKFSGIQFDKITPFYQVPENLVLPYQCNHITFEFAAIELARPGLVKYQYILEGYDKEWSLATNRTNATFGNMSEGTYTFRLKAQSPDGIWSKPIIYIFRVLPPWYRTWWAYVAYLGLLVTAVVTIVWWNGKRLRAKAKELAEEVRKATAEIREQKRMVEEQKAIVDEKNKDITDSIHYASRIQRALLTTDEYIGNYIKEYFILFKPRDIVSGDFYWAFAETDSSPGKRGVFHLACCDCTGHGVPGAFMSLLNISLLNEAVIERKINRPDHVLNNVRTNIIKALSSKGTDTDSKDGMDCIYCTVDIESKMLYAACANNSLCIIKHNNPGSIIELRPDKMPVGMQYGEQKDFTLHSAQMDEGDCVYLFTDGYADQFGGPKGKKFKYKQLEELLIANSGKPMAEQKRILNSVFEEWKGNLEQVDDVLIIGIRI